MLVLHQSICISKAGFSSLKQVQAEYNDKIPDVSDSHRNIGTPYNAKLKTPIFNDLCIKSVERLLKDEWMHVNN